MVAVPFAVKFVLNYLKVCAVNCLWILTTGYKFAVVLAAHCMPPGGPLAGYGGRGMLEAGSSRGACEDRVCCPGICCPESPS